MYSSLVCWETVTVFSSEWRPLGHVGGTTRRALTSAPRPRPSRRSHAFCGPPAFALRLQPCLPLWGLQPRDWGRAQRLSLVGVLDPTGPRRSVRGRARVRRAHEALRAPPGVRAPPAANACSAFRTRGRPDPTVPRHTGLRPGFPPGRLLGRAAQGAQTGSGAEARAHLLRQLFLSGEVVAGSASPGPGGARSVDLQPDERLEAPPPRHRPGPRQGGGQASHFTTWCSGRRRSARTGARGSQGSLAAHLRARCSQELRPPPAPPRQRRRRGRPRTPRPHHGGGAA